MSQTTTMMPRTTIEMPPRTPPIMAPTGVDLWVREGVGDALGMVGVGDELVVVEEGVGVTPGVMDPEGLDSYEKAKAALHVGEIVGSMYAQGGICVPAGTLMGKPTTAGMPSAAQVEFQLYQLLGLLP